MSTDSGQIEPRAGDVDGPPAQWQLPRLASGRRWCIIPKLDNDPVVVAYAQTLRGRLVVFVLFALLLEWLGQNPLLALLAEACALAGRYRWHVIPAATFIILYQRQFLIDEGLLATVASQEGVAGGVSIPSIAFGSFAIVVLSIILLIKFWPKISTVSLLHRPTLFVTSSFMILVLVAQAPVVGGASRVLLWALTTALLPYLWFLVYALGDIAAEPQRPASHYLGLFRPFWCNSPVPFGKSVAYLRKFEATTPSELAVTQIKAIKLALWAVLMAAFAYVFDMMIFQYLGIPKYDAVFLAFINGNSYPWGICWASLIAFYFRDILTISIIGAIFIAYARLAGFRLLRNTYKPLAATTLSEFWNRYFYYYKELLVDQFFYPTFFFCFRKHPKLRIFFATFTAACIGNLFFHFAMDIHFVAEMGWQRALVGEESHAFYTLLLALGIGLSQMRLRSPGRSQRRPRQRVFAWIGVALFFCVLHVFDAPEDREHSIWQRGQFLVHLSGLDTWM